MNNYLMTETHIQTKSKKCNSDQCQYHEKEHDKRWLLMMNKHIDTKMRMPYNMKKASVETPPDRKYTQKMSEETTSNEPHWGSLHILLPY